MTFKRRLNNVRRWFLFGDPSIYLAQGMTGYDRHEQVVLARRGVDAFAEFGFKTFSPVLEEGVPDIPGKLRNDKKSLTWKWDMDKQAIKYKCWALCWLNADLKSRGCEREYGKMRESQWQPVLTVSPDHAHGYVSVANYEDDILVGTPERAAEEFHRRFRYRHQRILWKLSIWNRCLLSWVWQQLRRLAQ